MNCDYTKNPLASIQNTIHESITSSHRKNPVAIVAVSKKKPASMIKHLYSLGQKDFGENYVQEALEKIHTLSYLSDITWHFIGSIQSNKTKSIAKHFHWVHSVDRLKIAERLHNERPDNLPPLNICIEVNIGNEPNKSGITYNNAAELALAISNLSNLKLRGLMVMPPVEKDPQKQLIPFRKTRELLNHININYHTVMDTLSMGTTADFPAAIAEGSTFIRIGTALFGSRN